MPIDGLPRPLVQQQRRRLDSHRAFGPPDLETIAALLSLAERVVPLREAAALEDDAPNRLIGLRHDTDQDIENSVRFAEWEAANGWRATYFVLHSDWYWRAPAAREPSRMVRRALERIASLGHEIGLHNNVLATALRTGEEPRAVLERELGWLRRQGHDVVGVARHGDRLCVPLGFLNDDLFVKAADSEQGNRHPLTIRTIEAADAPERLAVSRLSYRPIALAEVGLTYDAYRIPKTLYESDTGGRWRGPIEVTRSRFALEGGSLQLLAHPLWYAFRGEPYQHRLPPGPPSSGPAGLQLNDGGRAADGSVRAT